MNTLRKFMFLGSIALGTAIAEPMPISPMWSSPEFQRVLTGSYGIDSRIEPMITIDEEDYLKDAAELMAAEDRDGAIALYESSSLLKDSPAMTFSLANLKFENGETEEAIALFEEAIASFPNFRDAQRNLAMALIDAGQISEAKAPLIRAIQLGASDGVSLGLLAYCHAMDGNYQASLQSYRQAQITMPDEVQWKLGEAQALNQLGETRSAIALYRQILKNLPTDQPVWLNLAYALRQSDSDREAIVALEVLDSMQSLNAAERMVLGHLYLGQSLRNEALENYVTAMESETPPGLDQALGALEYLSGQAYWQETKTLLGAVETAHPDAFRESDLIRVRALVEFETGDSEKAIADIKALTTNDPLDGQALIMLGRFYQSQEKPIEARMVFDQAALLKPHAAEANLQLGRLAVSERDYETAVKHLETAQQIAPKPSVATYLDAVKELVK